jgi:hypothetical protein
LTQDTGFCVHVSGEIRIRYFWNVWLRLDIASYRLTHRLLLRHDFHLQFKYFGGAAEWLT